ncbi:heterokaryon incompatibility protein-domain-containing protein [Leptodontidium sp. 2 PMI_412]|nr:heterokaryon incompatibility protein-domain-containing protein [Leptodontidium sp. 2 PMI_412]
MATYTYKRLEGAEDIRILLLDPGRNQDEVTCHLSSTSIRAAPKYEALSYAWGDSACTRSIVCAGFITQVTVNLYDALWQFRYQDRPRILWVDALCINQQDAEEKSQQVGSMGDIYSNAEKVLIWLGKAPKDFSNAFPLENVKVALEFLSTADMARVKHHNWVPFVNLLQRPYFQRKWVIQEIIKAREAVAFCGRSSIPWSSIEQVCHCLLLSGLYSHMAPLLDADIGPHTGFDISRFAGIQHVSGLAFMREDSARNLPDMLFNARLSQCSDPRDRIFAVLSLLPDTYLEPGDLRPDYTASPEEVFKRCTIFEILKKHNLRILSCISTSPGNSEFLSASWVPQFDDSALGDVVDAGSVPWFHAAGESTVEAHVSDDKTTLYLRGKAVDTIKEIQAGILSMPLPDSNDPYVSSFRNLHDNTMAARKCSRRRKMILECREIAIGGQESLSEKRFEEFWRTMICDLGPSGRVPAAFGAEFAAYLQLMDHLLEMGHTWVHKWRSDFNDIENLINATILLRLCSTSRGRLGRVTRNAEIGDILQFSYGPSHYH